MNDELIKHQLETHEKRINNHSERLDDLKYALVKIKKIFNRA